jgi:molecular chaperone GrpE
VIDDRDSGTTEPERSDAARPAEEIPVKVVDRRWWARGDAGKEAGDMPLRKPTFVEQLELQLAEKDEQLRATIAKYKEAANEFEAARLRGRREVTREVERGKRAILAELLDVVDNLDRAIEASRQAAARPGPEAAPDPRSEPAGADFRTLLQGVEMVRDQFLARLEGFGVKRLEVLGCRFDPACHEAVTTVPTTEPARDDLVVGVIRNGYGIDGELLRPATVAVTRLVAI